jgi:hypothetical protein
MSATTIVNLLGLGLGVYAAICLYDQAGWHVTAAVLLLLWANNMSQYRGRP